MELILTSFIFVLSVLLGFELITKIPATLHTPLMSGSNAISGISIIGALIYSGSGGEIESIILGTSSVIFATVNVVGGYMVTDRMLGMIKKKS
tara:strand:- start:184 stop:462 length:279 start_codon:yes stop_codon:yes gene_type:complete